MAALRANLRLQVGSASWIAEERATALQFAGEETEEFTFSARNDLDWLNEHMAEIFSKNQVNVADIFKTPGKLRGKTPRTARKGNALEGRAPLTDIFSATSKGGASPFKYIHLEKPVATFKVAEDEPEQMEVETSPSTSAAEHRSPPKPAHYFVDSGYHGSQPEGATQATQATQPNDPAVYRQTPKSSPEKAVSVDSPESDENVVILNRDSDARRTTEESFQSAKEEQTKNAVDEAVQVEAEEEDMDRDQENKEPEQVSYPDLESPIQERNEKPESLAKRSSPRRSSPTKESPARPSPANTSPTKEAEPVEETQEVEDEHMEDMQSPSDGSPSPIRPIVRKSSLNFASLPAREPITTKKSIGNRVSRTSQLEQSRTSYYGRQTGGKSLGNVRPDEQNADEMDLDPANGGDASEDDTDSKMKRLHNKTSTQRLQDQISMLGQSQSSMRPSKSIPSSAVQTQSSQVSQPTVTQAVQREKPPLRKSRPPPGAFPEDEEDSWIGPPPVAGAEPSIFSPRPQMTKSHTTDVMEGIDGKESIGGAQFNIPKRGAETRNPSPVREPVIPERTTSTLGHIKSVSTSVLRSPKKSGDSLGQKKPISVSNPTPSIASNDPEASTTPPKSPARGYRGSPLKAAKDKFSSILKTSRGLFASSAAVSAEAKSSAISPVPSRTGLKSAPSFEDAMAEANNKSPANSQAPTNKSQLSLRLPESPFKHSARKTRASTEREEKKKEEQARIVKEAKETKEAQKMVDQLEKARMKVREEARVFHAEQERVAVMQKELATQKEEEKQAKASQVDIPRATRTSPRKTKAQLEAEGIAAAAASTEELANVDVEMSEASQTMPPPALPRPKSQIGRPGPKRPLKPAKESASKAKPPTVIRVDTGSQRGHHHHPSNVALSATLQESLASSQQPAPSQGLRHKASTSSIQSKASTSSFKSAASKALEAAARKKEQDELAAQRKREAKLEIERQRAAIKEEERRKEEQQRKQDLERQREIQRERERAASAADAKKAASRQAMEKRRLEMEKAKETRAPPPAVRPQPSVDFGSSVLQEKALPPVPPQRGDLAHSKTPRVNPANPRQEDINRPINPVLPNSSKVPPKRPLPQDNEEHHSRPALQRNGPSYQQEHQAKRRRTSEGFDDDEDMTEDHPKMTAPPIRQSSSRQKDMPTKSLFPSGYANAPPPGSLQRSTLIAQHNMNQSKPAHPMDMAQVSKAPILFASSSNQANHKTPARPGPPNGVGKSGAKSAAKSSPRYQNGENIVLPEIHTDSEDEDDDQGDFVAAEWTNSPDLRRRLVDQETMDPAAIFGQPGPLNMEEVFSKSKDRFHKFRARTSSANWSGQDRLTDDEIRKDLQARDQVRRQGGWTYDSMV